MEAPRIIILSFARLKPEIVTSPSEPETSSPSQAALYTKVSLSEDAVTSVPASISTRVPEMAGEETSKVKSIVPSVSSVTPSIVIEPLEPSALTPKSIRVDEIPSVTLTPSVFISDVPL